MNGEFIAKRMLPEFIQLACKKQGINFASFSDDWILRLEKNGTVTWIVGYRFGLNNAASDQLANDKVAQYLALQHQHIPCVEHYLAKSLESPVVKYSTLSDLNPDQPYVTKPLSSSGGRGIQLHKDLSDALRSIDNGLQEEWAVSPYYTIVAEKRLIVLDDTILLAYKKLEPTDRHGLRMFNLGLGATPSKCDASKHETSLALRAANICNLRLCAVDIVTLASGEQKIMEINSGIMMEYYARQSQQHHETADRVYDTIVSKLF